MARTHSDLRKKCLAVPNGSGGTKPLADPSILEELADRTEGSNGPTLEFLIKEAALAGVRHCAHSDAEALQVRGKDLSRALQVARSRERIFNRWR